VKSLLAAAGNENVVGLASNAFSAGLLEKIAAEGCVAGR